MHSILAAALLLGAAPAGSVANEVPTTLAAKVEDHAVAHAAEKLRVVVPASATYVGSERFNLYGVADAEVHVFAEAGPAKAVQKLYWVQFEKYLPSDTEVRRYNYGTPDNTKFDLWGAPTWLRWGPQRSASPTRPGSDREHVTAILKRAGYAIPPEMMSVRMVQILDDKAGNGQGTRELMVIYAEDLAPTGKTYAELVTDGKINEAAWKPLEQPLLDRATKAVRIDREPVKSRG